MKVNRIKIQNIKAIEDLEVDFKGCSVIVTAGNNNGKSTLLKSLPERLTGKKAEIREGQTEGYCEWELSNGDIFTWELNEGKGDKLRLITKDILKIPVTKQITSKYFPSTFDIDKFLQMSKNKQKEEIEKISGIDTTKLNEEYKEAYDNRAYVNRTLRDLGALNTNFDEYISEVIDDTEEELRDTISKADVINLQITNTKESVVKKKEEVKRLTLQLKEAKEIVKKEEAWLKENFETNKEAYEEELEEVRKNNALIEENNKKRENFKKVASKKKEAHTADQLVKELVDKRNDIVAKSNMPEGFTFNSDGDLYYDGFPFNKDSLSSSAIYIAALKLASLSLGTVRAIHFDASFLDKISLGEIQKWAEAQDLQLLIERPDYEGSKEITYEFVE